jgi:hypothetical protein
VRCTQPIVTKVGIGPAAMNLFARQSQRIMVSCCPSHLVKGNKIDGLAVTDYILEMPAKCPNCKSEIPEKTL